MAVNSADRLAAAAERIATALEFFQGRHPDYMPPTDGSDPLPSSNVARELEKKKQAELKRQADIAAKAEADCLAKEAEADKARRAQEEKDRAEGEKAAKAAATKDKGE
jgi:hypothetical protein